MAINEPKDNVRESEWDGSKSDCTMKAPANHPINWCLMYWIIIQSELQIFLSFFDKHKMQSKAYHIYLVSTLSCKCYSGIQAALNI